MNSRYLPLIGRLLIGVPFAMSGLSKLVAYGPTTAMISAVGLPFPPLAFAGAVAAELGGGLLLILGYRVRPAALALALFSVATAFSFHRDFADQNQMIHFLKNLMMAGGLLQIVAFGAGAISIEQYRRNTAEGEGDEHLMARIRNVREFLVLLLAVIGSVLGTLPALAAAQSREQTMTTFDTFGPRARQAIIDIFRKKDTTAVERYFADTFIQHDPNLADGLAGMTSLAAEVASSPAADITIYRTLVDGDFVLLHSRYEGVRRYAGPVIAFDLFRFADGKIVEHWGGQEPEAPPNLSGRTQVDGPTEVLDREKTEANRTLAWTYRQTVIVSLRFDRIEEFIEGARYAQHASKIGDGIAQLRDRIASVAKEGGQLHLTPRRFVAEGNFVLVLSEGELPSGPTALYDLFRVENGKIVEHWDVLTPIPPRDRWKNQNGPF
jgi:predicted SnoaL-like aldol condensation-catalyzing enzyme/uncharacterized membrane protein YphA (DoxX/SURF4 family)